MVLSSGTKKRHICKCKYDSNGYILSYNKYLVFYILVIGTD